jgi:uncharacterized protein (DUF4415 family)
MTRSSQSRRIARERMLRNLRALEDESVVEDLIRDLCPDAWRTLEEDVEVREKKVQVTLRLDESVAKFYRAMGRGYQGRINRILATYAQMRIAKANMFERDFAAWDREWRRTGEMPNATGPAGLDRDDD